ncbi:MAG TPA: 1-(5-phosphoribosyl)-5-[(5-phosphoribosylamino)methylideneamino]imidazole-4-carboxamide isomerase [Candidatus Desulfofervidus auxilii]|uniref:1-(5-phosphoribosyl)-5-[(5-phosphoribosylamino)methylideneamino] imidazole-4-carboxamide isomerase n=1 Tax=Desulfofervidus auxilii TaxID=1621989 RepID=A0A7V0NE23_DESA2|nr:1-(5-phosphoribosyl)-5-[(5-phosphoribosylamino)methylideneamino]imidazole-4-carboxamide isomerase [Candidatus Desulfofervidus auxilii]
MLIIPAIDLKNRKCVRLRQGMEGTETVFHEDPILMANIWEKQGAKRLHIVDLDGAFLKHPVHQEIIVEIAKAVSIPVQVGGGIRTQRDIETYLKAGVSYIILGTLALEDEKRFKEICKQFPDRIILAIDVRNGKVAVEGWKKLTDKDAISLAKKAQELGVTAINYTDIFKDGTETGINMESIKVFLKEVDVPVYVAGGISSLKDIAQLLSFENKGLNGVIIGRAFYTGKINLKDAMRLVRRGHGRGTQL